jgi:hypothetical protein
LFAFLQLSRPRYHHHFPSAGRKQRKSSSEEQRGSTTAPHELTACQRPALDESARHPELRTPTTHVSHLCLLAA